MEGRSLCPSFKDPSIKIRDTLHFANRGVQRAVKRENWKLIEYVVDGKRVTQLFDLSSDPREMNNLAGSPGNAERLQSLRKELKRWRSKFNDTRMAGGQFWDHFDSQEKLGPWKPGSHVHE